MIKPIETVYNGYRFRSRLQARWAVFFDEIGIKYTYESQGYELQDGTRYLPDFYLTQFNYYVQVKGSQQALETDIKKVIKFVKNMQNTNGVILLFDIPVAKSNQRMILDLIKKTENGVKSSNAAIMQYQDQSLRIRQFHRLYDLVYAYTGQKDEEIDRDVSETKVGTSVFEMKDLFKLDNVGTPRTTKALEKARQARFQFNETPTVRKP